MIIDIKIKLQKGANSPCNSNKKPKKKFIKTQYDRDKKQKIIKEIDEENDIAYIGLPQTPFIIILL